MDIILGALLFKILVVLGYPLWRNDLVAVLISFSIRDLKKRQKFLFQFWYYN